MTETGGWITTAGGEGCAAVDCSTSDSTEDQWAIMVTGGAGSGGQFQDRSGDGAGIIIVNALDGTWEPMCNTTHAPDWPCPRTGHSCCSCSVTLNDSNGPATSQQGVVILGGCSLEYGYLSLSTAHVYCTKKKAWMSIQTKGTVPLPRDKHVAFVSNNSIFVFGGFGPCSAERDCHIGSDINDNDVNDDDCDELEEQEEADDNGDEYGHQCAEFKWFNDLHELNTSTWTWRRISTKGDTPTPRAASACCCLDDGRVLLFGGRDASGRLNDTYTLGNVGKSLHLQIDDSLEWTQHKISTPLITSDRQSTIGATAGAGNDKSTSMPPKRSFHSMTSISSPLFPNESPVFLIGGLNTNNDCCDDFHVLDVRTMTWYKIVHQSNMTVHANASNSINDYANVLTRAGCSLLSRKETLVIIGGYTDSNFYDDIYAIDTSHVVKKLYNLASEVNGDKENVMT